MYKLILPVVLAAFVASSATADISSGPVGPYVVVDSTGKLVGGLGPTSYMQNYYVSVDTSVGAGFLQHDSFGDFTQKTTVYFSSTDCTGPAYARATSGDSLRLDGGPALVVGRNDHLYAATGPEITVALASSINSSGTCQSESSTSTKHPVEYVGDLSAEFTAPFQIQTAATHYASLPFSLWWLLGGVLLGFGIKNAVKKS